MAENETQGITRRDLLRRGAALGGAVVWATPVVQTLGMGRAFAQTASPCTPAVSFIAMCVTCVIEGQTVSHIIKWEADGGWERDPQDPVCGLDCGSGAHGGDLGFRVESAGAGCYRVVVPDNCSVSAARVFGGNQPCDDVTGSLSRICCPGFN